MLNVTELESFKQIAPFMVNLFPGGVMFVTTDREKVDWKIASDVFDVPVYTVGIPLRVDGASYNAIQEKRTVTEKVPRAIYGMRLVITAVPIFDEDQVVGTIGIIIPRLNAIAKAFPDFAPMVANMFPEGGFLYMTDLEKFAYRQGSDKFDIPEYQKGTPLSEKTVAQEVIRNKKMVDKEIDASVYGFPVAIKTYPQFDEDDPTKVVATFGVAVPRAKAVQLKEMASNMDRGLIEIASLLEELSSSATEIATNEQQLNQNVQEIYRLSEDINSVLGFIQQIADETKMLGLNAAIEAARAGEAGRGFAVVAGEVKDLANQSRLSAENISDMISVLDKQSEDAAQMMEEANLQVNGGIQSVSDTLEVFKEIVVSMDEINRRISDVAASSEEQATSVQEITAIINEVLSGIRQTAVQADKNNRITAEMSAAITQMVHITESVSKIAESLTEEIDQFKVS